MNIRARLLRSTISLSTTLSTTLALGAALPPPALAQNAKSTSQAGQDTAVEEIVVTGSHIVREGYDAPTPLSVVSTEQIEASADTNIANFLVNNPVFSGSQTARNNTYGSSARNGADALSLRSLGTNRTLVLLDGRRIEPASSAGEVDTSSLPQQLISRVDVVTGGASAVYGSDAIAGVVNFILDKDFKGVKGEVAGGLTNYGDNKNYSVDLAAGAPFADNRGHILISGTTTQADRIKGNSRDWALEGPQTITNPSYKAGSGLPANLFLLHSAYATGTPGGIVLTSAGALITTGPLAATAFGQNGVPYNVHFGDIVTSSGFERGGDWQNNDQRPLGDIAPETRRQNLFTSLTFDLTDNIKAYAQYSWSYSFVDDAIGPVFRQGASGPLIQIDNAFLPATVKAAMTAAGVTQIRVGSFNQDLGPVISLTDRYSRRYLAGLQGELDAFGSNWHWDVYYQAGHTRTRQITPTNLSVPNYTAAVDAVVNPVSGRIECRTLATNPNCVPFNAMGVGVNDPNGPAVAYVRSPGVHHGSIVQDIYAASFSGEPFSLPAGPVSVAASAEHREDSINMTRDALSNLAQHIYFNAPLVVGATNVTEGNVETVVPLVKGVSWADNWDFSAAGRYTSYNLAGNVFTWKLGTTYSPIPDIKVRVTRSRDIRAPDMVENFDSGNVNRNNVLDAKYNTQPLIENVTSGNTNLKPEIAQNFSAGLVLQPSWLEGFSISADYWKININGAISLISSQNVIAYCYNGIRPDFCANVIRDPATDVVTRVYSTSFNFANQKVSGLDLETSYRTALDRLISGAPGNIAFHANMTFNFEDIIDTGLIGIKPIDYVGENSGANLPHWRLNATLAYDLEPMRVSLTARAFSSGTQYANYIQCTTGCPDTTAANPTINDNSLTGRFYLDMAMNYDFSFESSTGTVFLNIKNLFNKDPALENSQIFFAPPANRGLYDTDGRVFRAGIRFKI